MGQPHTTLVPQVNGVWAAAAAVENEGLLLEEFGGVWKAAAAAVGNEGLLLEEFES